LQFKAQSSRMVEQIEAQQLQATQAQTAKNVASTDSDTRMHNSDL